MILTEIDSRAAIKGSRDPLGLVPLWGHFGRSVVGNLTTVSNSVSGFRTLLLGYYFAQEARERAHGASEDAIQLFLKFEQLVAYSRVRAGDESNIRGIERVKKALAEGDRIRISAAQADQILSDQKVYGLWGLFSTPARASGLVEHDEPALTAEARLFTEKAYVKRLGPEVARSLVGLIGTRASEFRLDGQHRSIAEGVVRLFSRPDVAEKQFFDEHLLAGGPADTTGGRQRTLADLMRGLPPQQTFDRQGLRELIKKCDRRGDHGGAVAERLRKIDAIESMLVAASSAFRFLLARGGQTVGSAATEIRRAWKSGLKFIDPVAIGALRADFDAGCSDLALAGCWMGIADCLASGDYDLFVDHLLRCNERVMTGRNGSSPWIRRDSKGKLDVRFRDEEGSLADRGALAGAWRNSYFLDSLKAVLDELRGRT